MMKLVNLVVLASSTIFLPVVSNEISSYDAIRDTLSRYPLAVDSKNFTALSLVFTADAVANYSAPLNVLNGLPAIEGTLQQSLAAVGTQHALSTQVIDIVDGGAKANTTT